MGRESGEILNILLPPYARDGDSLGEVKRKGAACSKKPWKLIKKKKYYEGGHCGCKYLWQPSGKHLNEIAIITICTSKEMTTLSATAVVLRMLVFFYQ